MNRTIWIIGVIVGIMVAGSQLGAQQAISSDNASLAPCVLPTDAATRDFLHLSRKAQFVSFISVDHGVPRTSNEMAPITSFLFLSPKHDRGLLMSVLKLGDGRRVALEDFYMMRKRHGVWEASNGNGGPGTYERVEQFVKGLLQRHPARVSFNAPVPKSCIGEREWELEVKTRKK